MVTSQKYTNAVMSNYLRWTFCVPIRKNKSPIIIIEMHHHTVVPLEMFCSIRQLCEDLCGASSVPDEEEKKGEKIAKEITG